MPIHLPGGTHSRCSPFKFSSASCIFPTLVPQHAKEAMIFRVGPSTLTGVLALLMVKHQPDGVPSSPHGRIHVMFGPVVTTEAHLAYTGAKIHSNNTAEMSAIIEALSFLGPHGPVARDVCSCVFYDSKHAAGVCLGTVHARTHVQLGLSCQQSLAEGAIYRATRPQSRGESWKRMRGSCRRIGCIWLSVEP